MQTCKNQLEVSTDFSFGTSRFKCEHCKEWGEKRTDVNMATEIVSDLYDKRVFLQSICIEIQKTHHRIH